MVPAALLVSRDPAVLDLMRRSLEEEQMSVEVSPDVRQACDLLEEQKFDAVIVDCDDLLGVEVLLCVRRAPTSRRAVAFALLNGITSLETAFALGANFVLDKPLCPDLTRRSVRAACGLIQQERRHYFRYAVDLAVSLTLAAGHSVYAHATSLSEDGMSVELQAPLPAGNSIEIRFDLPGTATTVEARGEVAWRQEQYAGIRFHEILQMSKTSFRRWLAENMPEHPGPSVFVNATRRSV